MAATRTHPVQAARLHPLAEAQAVMLSGGDRARWRIEGDRCVLVVNYHGWQPGHRGRKQRKAK